MGVLIRSGGGSGSGGIGGNGVIGGGGGGGGGIGGIGIGSGMRVDNDVLWGGTGKGGVSGFGSSGIVSMGGGLGGVGGGLGGCVREVGVLLLHQWRVVCHRLASFESSSSSSSSPPRDCVGGVGGLGSNTHVGGTSETSNSQPLHTPSHTPSHTPLHAPFFANTTSTLPPMHVQIWISYLSSRLLYMWSLNVKVPTIVPSSSRRHVTTHHESTLNVPLNLPLNVPLNVPLNLPLNYTNTLHQHTLN